MRQREIAALADIQTSSWGNLESSPYRTVRWERVQRVLDRLRLPPVESEAIRAAYDATPESPFAVQRKAGFVAKRTQRTAARQHDRLRLALLDLLGLLALEGRACDHGDAPDATCALCGAMRVLGLDRWDEAAAERLAQLAEPPAAAPPPSGSDNLDGDFGGAL